MPRTKSEKDKSKPQRKRQVKKKKTIKKEKKTLSEKKKNVSKTKGKKQPNSTSTSKGKKKCDISYRSKKSGKHFCIPVYPSTMKGGKQEKYEWLVKKATALQEEHDQFQDRGITLGDNKQIDRLEDELDAVLEEMLRLQIQLDEKCAEANTKETCGPKCTWLEQSWKWYHFVYDRKGICVSKKRALLLNEKYHEGLDQLKVISDKLDAFSSSPKKRLSAAELETKKYLEYLKRKLQDLAIEDTSSFQNLAGTLVLLDSYRKELAKAKTESEKQRLEQLIQVAEKQAEKLNKKTKSSRIKWAIAAVFSVIVLGFFVYLYTMYYSNVGQTLAQATKHESAAKEYTAHLAQLNREHEVYGSEILQERFSTETATQKVLNQEKKISNVIWNVGVGCAGSVLESVLAASTSWIPAIQVISGPLAFLALGKVARCFSEKSKA